MTVRSDDAEGWDLLQAVARAIGVTLPDDIAAARLEWKGGELPTFTVTTTVWRPGALDVDEVQHAWRPANQSGRDESRRVRANLTGNTVQDLAEYAAAGGIRLASLAACADALAALNPPPR